MADTYLYDEHHQALVAGENLTLMERGEEDSEEDNFSTHSTLQQKDIKPAWKPRLQTEGPKGKPREGAATETKFPQEKKPCYFCKKTHALQM